ncbi:MAG: DNA/RNA nuclease SfsA [Limnochordaceae bacterium]|nr:DNA/RNA nuclease SfsA [Limnochordaceae bacterium]
MILSDRLTPGRFVRRLNRFTVEVRNLAGQSILAHLANSGRLQDLLVPGIPCLLTPARLGVSRARTQADLAFVARSSSLGWSHEPATPCWSADFPGKYEPEAETASSAWVSVSAALPNRLVAESLRRQPDRWRHLLGWSVGEWRAEVPAESSRLDFRLWPAGDRTDLLNPHAGLWLEVKSVTLVEQGWARFPDAPTMRGRRHLQELARMVQQGGRAAILFVVQREDARGFAPNERTDPLFASALREAVDAGVQVWALSCQVRPPRVELVVRPLPIQLRSPSA